MTDSFPPQAKFQASFAVAWGSRNQDAGLIKLQLLLVSAFSPPQDQPTGFWPATEVPPQRGVDPREQIVSTVQVREGHGSLQAGVKDTLQCPDAPGVC